MQIIGMVSLSHSPSWKLQPEQGAAKPYVDAVFAVREKVRAAKADLMIVFGPDHVRNFFFDLMPAFCMGVEAVTAFGDFSSPKGPLPTNPVLAAALAKGVMERGFDPALSYNMGIDHGISQPYAALDPTLTTPILPIMVSSAGPPLPTLRRCYDFGAALGEAIRAHPGSERILAVGSGGMSHSPPSIAPDDPLLSAEMRDYVISGRDRVAESNAARERSSAERVKAGGTGPINEAWDRWVLECLRGDIEPLLALSNEALLSEGGVGGQELRSWIAAMGVWGGVAQTTDYAPVPTWITGMGCISAFEKETS
jgi:2,3-dihydroxyphenylpropionate 1,2-dioxygenase